MRAVDIIAKKRDQGVLTSYEIDFFLKGYQTNLVPDYQMSALLMAIYWNGLNDNELFEFTKSMVNSGIQIGFENDLFVVDKHSSGGVGDKITLALAPLLAECNISTAKLSGRGLGHTGGTIDKFEAIKGFQFSKTEEELKLKMKNLGFGLMGACPDVVPLDKKIYNLRDVTATVGSMPLMVSSILSKKLALKSDLILLDLKVGSGAFIKTVEDGRLLANKMQIIAKMFDRKLICMLTNMNQPLGFCIGNLNEVLEAGAALKNEVSNDFTELLIEISAQILMCKDQITYEESLVKIRSILKSQSAFTRYKKFLDESNGDSAVLNNSWDSVHTNFSIIIKSKSCGFLSEFLTDKLGEIAMKLGAGREKKEDDIDHKVGVIVYKKIGDYINKNEPVLRIDYNIELDKNTLIDECLSCIVLSENETEKSPVVYEIIK